jgi:hypothetical protein
MASTFRPVFCVLEFVGTYWKCLYFHYKKMLTVLHNKMGLEAAAGNVS